MTQQINANQPITDRVKKRVLFVITQSEWGGAQQFLYRLIAGLNKETFQILLAVGHDGDGALTRKLEGIAPVTTLGHLRRNPRFIDDLKAITELKNLIHSWQPQTLFLNSSKAGFLGTLAARWYGLNHKKPRIIYRIGGWAFNDPRSKWQNSVYRYMEKITAGWKDVIILNNQHDLDQAKKFGIQPREQIALIHNGLDPYKISFFSREEAQTTLIELAKKQNRKLESSDFWLGMVSNFYTTKGLNYAIQALAEINAPHAKLLIIGDGPQRRELEKLINQNKLEQKVILLGRIEDAARLMPAFDAFVLSSVKEGFPWAVIEALAAKLPVIATTVGGVTDIIKDQKNGVLVPPADSRALAKAIDFIIDNEAIRERLAIEGNQTLILDFDPVRMFSKVESLL